MPKDIERALRECFHPKEGRSNLHKIPISIERTKQHTIIALYLLLKSSMLSAEK